MTDSAHRSGGGDTSAAPVDTNPSESYYVKPLKAARLVGIGRTKLMQMALRGEIPSAKIGGSRLFPRQQLLEWAENEWRAQSSDAGPRLSQDGRG